MSPMLCEYTENLFTLSTCLLWSGQCRPVFPTNLVEGPVEFVANCLHDGVAELTHLVNEVSRPPSTVPVAMLDVDGPFHDTRGLYQPVKFETATLILIPESGKALSTDFLKFSLEVCPRIPRLALEVSENVDDECDGHHSREHRGFAIPNLRRSTQEVRDMIRWGRWVGVILSCRCIEVKGLVRHSEMLKGATEEMGQCRNVVLRPALSAQKLAQCRGLVNLAPKAPILPVNILNRSPGDRGNVARGMAFEKAIEQVFVVVNLLLVISKHGVMFPDETL